MYDKLTSKLSREPMAPRGPRKMIQRKTNRALALGNEPHFRRGNYLAGAATICIVAALSFGSLAQDAAKTAQSQTGTTADKTKKTQTKDNNGTTKDATRGPPAPGAGKPP